MINRLIDKILENILPLDKLAKRAGVSMGKGNEIESPFWKPAEPYLIKIGDNCQITHAVQFFTHGGGNSVRKMYPKFDCFGKISIGNYVYIGSNSLIMPGVEIGDNVIIASGSVVTKSIPSNVVIGGNPAKIISTIFEYTERNMKYNLDSKGLSLEKKKELLLSLPDDKFIKKRAIEYGK